MELHVIMEQISKYHFVSQQFWIYVRIVAAVCDPLFSSSYVFLFLELTERSPVYTWKLLTLCYLNFNVSLSQKRIGGILLVILGIFFRYDLWR